jgi:hypothetical protein
MDDQTFGSVRDALQRYRTTVEICNFNSLRILVDGMMSQPPGQIRPEWADKLRLQVFNNYLGIDARTIASSPEDFLLDEVRPLLITKCDLDGVNHITNDLDRRERWFETIRKCISELGVNTAPFPPQELQYVSGVVSGVCGPGLHYWQVRRQFALLDMLLGDEQLLLTKGRVLTPTEESNLSGIWDEWEIVVAVRIGGGPRSWGGSYALYCRNASHKVWKWRYGVHDGDWRSDIYDNLEAYLDYYARFKEPTEEQVKKAVRPLMTLV